MSLQTDELKFEDELITKLTTLGGVKQWEYRPDIKTTEALWDNFKNILENNNQDKLDQPLSKNEFNQVKQIINNLKTPYEAGQFLYGLNGVSQIEVDLDSGEHVYLTVFDQAQVGAGNTKYQVVNQIQRKAVIPGFEERRFDTTLLINGLPIIQIEEKASNHDTDEALNQMQQYIYEKQYTGIYSTLQILVGMTPEDVKYIANTTDEKFNKAFAFRWQRKNDNSPVMNWNEFTSSVLSIPMAHQMATNYMILDGTPKDQTLKVMRPYQVYAASSIIQKVRQHNFDVGPQEIGYVWHATGSGKTISSFKTAWLASHLPNVDKVVFLVDRVALTNQTVEEYSAYDPEKDENGIGGVVTDATNRWVLANKLKTKRNGIIVTSLQKMSALVKNKEDISSLINKNILFIVDEAHRSTAGDMLNNIKKALPRSAWVGYTGTPNFDNYPTTKDIFGSNIHSYTISDAIRDGNTLGFKVDFETTLSEQVLKEQYLPAYFKARYPNYTEEDIKNRIANLQPEDTDDMIEPSVYDNNGKHVEMVVKDILDNWDKRSRNGEFNALLTTHVGGNRASTPMAMMYYREFKKQNSLRDKPLRIGITFSQDKSNDDGQLENNKSLYEAMRDYNEEFGTNFGPKDVKEYTDQVVARLNRSIDDDKYFDIVIVVDQLLTGFDAPQLNTLYVDRTLKGAALIQAYSRTNRVFNMQTKPFGRIVNYRWPVQSEKYMKQALAKYADRHSADEQTDLIEVESTNEGVIVPEFSEIKKDLTKVVNSLSDLTDNFTTVPQSLEKERQDQMLRDLREYNHLMAMAKQDDEYDAKNPNTLLDEIGISERQEEVLTTTLAIDLRKSIAKRMDVDFSAIDLEMEHVKEVRVSYSYLKQLIAKLMNQKHEKNEEGAKATAQRIKELSARMDDRKKADKINDFTDQVLADKVVGDYPIHQEDIDELLQKYTDRSEREEILSFKRKWGLVDIASSQKVNNVIYGHIEGSDDLNLGGELDDIVREASAVYKTDAEDEEIQSLNKIKYRRQLRDHLQKFADEIVKKY
ncbi:type I restriction endonuclease subunit R [Lactobacillus agrestimuris]|uniref:type I restriction endonuclease subunit R n=1 Tax=Lactobacillus agrestimuris TaxID=2941328 RepID=UPI0020430454|nr:HsdR family type I site-specific deoxyribonuclease [Lactobacillus agrestimuris]